MIHYDIPARTAQGGGGSFKDRKPIGEVRCCDIVIHGWQSTPTDGSERGWSVGLSICLTGYLTHKLTATNALN